MAGPGLVTLTVIVTSSPFFTGLGLAVWLTTRSADALAGSARAAMATAATPMPRPNTWRLYLDPAGRVGPERAGSVVDRLERVARGLDLLERGHVVGVELEVGGGEVLLEVDHR